MILKIKSPVLEDLIEKHLVWEFFDRKHEGVFVEVGANDPHNGSQTWLLEQNGWTGMLVEPQAALCDKLRRERKNSAVFQVACSGPDKEGEASLHIAAHDGISTLEPQADSHGIQFVGTERVKITTLDKVLSMAGTVKVDFLSLDVEGYEIEVMRGFDFKKYQPSLILIEDEGVHQPGQAPLFETTGLSAGKTNVAEQLVCARRPAVPNDVLAGKAGTVPKNVPGSPIPETDALAAPAAGAAQRGRRQIIRPQEGRRFGGSTD